MSKNSAFRFHFYSYTTYSESIQSKYKSGKKINDLSDAKFTPAIANQLQVAIADGLEKSAKELRA